MLQGTKIKDLGQKLLFTAGYLAVIAAFGALGVPCIFQTLFGIPCPGCGMTRALKAAAQLDLRSAFGFHPMFGTIPVIYLFFLFDGKLTGRPRLDKAILILIGMGFAVSWIAALAA